MVFNTTTGSRRSICINNPNIDLPTEETSAAIDKMLEYDVFDQSKGGLDILSKMELSTIERTAIL